MFFKKYRFWFNCWWIVWGVLAIVFSFYMVTFFLGNHDWQYLRYDIPLKAGMWEARFTQFVPLWLFSMGRMLPIWNALLGFMFFSAAAVLLAWWYQLKPKRLQILLFSLLIVLHPYICAQLYYVHTILSVGCWHFFCVFGVVLGWRFAENHEYKYFIGASMCLLVSLCGYAPCIELVATVVLGKFLQDVLSKKKFERRFVGQYIIFALSMLFIVSVYVGIIAICCRYHFIAKEMYNTQSLSLLEILLKIIKNIDKPFEVLNVLIPYTKRVVNICIWGLALSVLFDICKASRKFWAFLGLFGLFFASILVAYISPHDIYLMWRSHAYSLPYFVAILYMLVRLSRYQLVKNWGFVLSVMLLFSFVSADLMTQKVWYLGNMQDDKAVERVKADLLPKMGKDKHYRLSIIGNLYGRKKFADVAFVSDGKLEIYREYWGAPHFIHIFFSSGLFAYEAYNPIWGDAMYLGEDILYGLSNESVKDGLQIYARLFANHYGADCLVSPTLIYRLKSFPKEPYFLVKQKDIFLMLGDDNHIKNVLVKNIKKE